MGIRLIAILGCWSAAALWLRPFTPVPFIDDWVYGWSVENLLTTGRLETLDFSSNIAYGQTMWGALFSWPTGFSFAALRVSTWVLSLVTLLGMHQLLVDADATEAGAAFGTASLAVFPPFVLLSFSFMTEVPLLAAETWTLVFMLRAWRGQSLGALWIAAALAAVAAAIRVVGVIPALAMSAALILDSRGWGRARARFMVPLAAVLCAAALTWYNVSHIRHVADLTHVTNTPAPRLAAFHEHALTLLPAWLPLSVEFLGVGLGLALPRWRWPFATSRGRSGAWRR